MTGTIGIQVSGIYSHGTVSKSMKNALLRNIGKVNVTDQNGANYIIFLDQLDYVGSVSFKKQECENAIILQMKRSFYVNLEKLKSTTLLVEENIDSKLSEGYGSLSCILVVGNEDHHTMEAKEDGLYKQLFTVRKDFEEHVDKKRKEHGSKDQCKVPIISLVYQSQHTEPTVHKMLEQNGMKPYYYDKELFFNPITIGGFDELAKTILSSFDLDG
jgi:hypothetical protein